MARAPRSDGSKFALATAADLALPLPEPLFELSERGRKYWPIVINSKRREAWTDSDLFQAAGLAEDYGELERLRTLMQKQSPLVQVKEKKYEPHPALKLIEDISARIVRTCRALQIHAIATVGLTHHQRDKNQAAREIATAIDNADDDLIARPKVRVVK